VSCTRAVLGRAVPCCAALMCLVGVWGLCALGARHNGQPIMPPSVAAAKWATALVCFLKQHSAAFTLAAACTGMSSLKLWKLSCSQVTHCTSLKGGGTKLIPVVSALRRKQLGWEGWSWGVITVGGRRACTWVSWGRIHLALQTVAGCEVILERCGAHDTNFAEPRGSGKEGGV
jgi:hypothetical protein